MKEEQLNVMNALTGKIYNLLTAADNINPGSPPPQNRWICFAAPGLAMDKGQLKFGNLTGAQELTANAAFSDLVNSIPSVNGSWAPKADKVWHQYFNAITQVELPSAELSEKEKGMLDKAEKFLWTTTTVKDPFNETAPPKTTRESSAYVKAYNAYEAKYSQLLMSFNQMVLDATKAEADSEAVRRHSINGPILRRQTEQAFAAWTAEGYKEWTEQARGIISNLTGKAPHALYNSLKANFASSKRATLRNEEFYPTFCYPDDCLNSQYNDSWTKFSFTSGTQDDKMSAQQISYGADSGWEGLWSVKVEGRNDTTTSESETTGLKLTAELLQVPIQRSWMNASIFANRNWRWSQSGSNQPISKGGSPPSGSMPLIPVSIILAKNLSIKITMSSEKNREAKNQIDTNANVGWGPFRVSGRYSQANQSSEHNAKFSDTGITVAGAQIIGVVCTIIPGPCPNPDPKLNWQK